MTSQKSFKSRVRTRMTKTGERYAAARRQLIEAGADHQVIAAEPVSTPTHTTRSLVQRHSDEVLLERTGSSWDQWFALLDEHDSTSRTHTEIARWLRDAIGVDSWWSQTITVGYEQERGLRVPGQQADGSFAASASKTIAVSAQQATDAFTDDALRARWLPDMALHLRTVRPGHTLSATVVDEPGRLSVGFTPKGEDRCQVSLLQAKLPDAATGTRLTAHWRERLAGLKRVLKS